MNINYENMTKLEIAQKLINSEKSLEYRGKKIKKLIHKNKFSIDLVFEDDDIKNVSGLFAYIINCGNDTTES